MSSIASAIASQLGSAAQWLRAQGRLPESVTSIFFGGGTPSLLSPELLFDLWHAISRNFSVANDAEVTLEANPETVTRLYCERLATMGFLNRVSLGAQSFQSSMLERLERRATVDGIHHAVDCLTHAGFSNYNLDLIFGIPGQDVTDVIEDLRQAMALKPNHISWYNLTLKPGHPLYGRLPSGDEAAELYEQGVETLAGGGYAQYEISNFSLLGFESRHNLLYWSGGDFLGVGPSSASRFFWGGKFHHRRQAADFHAFLAAPRFPDPGFESSSRAQTVLEASFLELRKNVGVHLSYFRERYGYDLTKARNYHRFRDGGLIQVTKGRLRLTSRGRLLADSVTRDVVDL